jgi:hypothetical protein
VSWILNTGQLNLIQDDEQYNGSLLALAKASTLAASPDGFIF